MIYGITADIFKCDNGILYKDLIFLRRYYHDAISGVCFRGKEREGG